MSTWQKLNDGDISDRHTRGLLTHTCWMGIDVVHHLYSFTIFCSEDLQLLQHMSYAWQLLERLLYQSTVGKEANAPGLSQTCQPLSIVSLSAMIQIAFLHSSIFCASFASTFRYFLSYIILIIIWAYQVMRLCMTYVVIGLTIVALQNISFLIRSFLILCWIHPKILISVMFIFWRSALCNA